MLPTLAPGSARRKPVQCFVGGPARFCSRRVDELRARENGVLWSSIGAGPCVRLGEWLYGISDSRARGEVARALEVSGGWLFCITPSR